MTLVSDPAANGVIRNEPADIYHARRDEYLTSHQLADFRKCPLAVFVDLSQSPPTYDFTSVLETGSVIYDVEVVIGSQTGDTLFGGEADDDLRGFSGNDYLFGHQPGFEGTTRLYGGVGDDYLFGATLYVGGPGLDACDASPIIPAERHGCEVIWTYD